MKFLKKLFITLIVIVLLIGGGIAAVYVLLYDNQTSGFKNVEGGFDVANHLSNSVYDSLENIKATNYEDNKLTVEFTEDNLNALIISMVQKKVEGYPETKKSIVEKAGAALDCVYVKMEGSTIDLYACARYTSLMYTSLKISADFKIEDNSLVFKVDTVKLGKYLGISSEKAASLLSGYIPKGESIGVPGLDLRNMTYSIDLNQLIKDNVQEPFVRDLLVALKYNAKVEDGVIKLSIDTSDIFTGPRTPIYGDITGVPDIPSIIAGLNPLDPTFTVELNESQFNALAAHDLNEGLDQFHPAFDFGEKHFEFGIADPYYSIKDAEVETSFSLNGVQSTACFYADMQPIYDESHSEIVIFDITATIASVGNMKFSGMEDFSFSFQVESSSLTNNMAKIKSFEIDKENSKVSLTLEPNLSFSL